jgi:hypothetical protein
MISKSMPVWDADMCIVGGGISALGNTRGLGVGEADGVEIPGCVR